MSGVKNGKASKFSNKSNKSNESSNHKTVETDKPEKKLKIPFGKKNKTSGEKSKTKGKTNNGKSSTKKTQVREKPNVKQAPRSRPEKTRKGGFMGKIGKTPNLAKSKEQTKEVKQEVFNVYSYLKSENYQPDLTAEPSRYIKLLMKTLEKRNVAGITSLEEADDVMQEIETMIKEVRYLLEDTGDLIIDDDYLYDDDANDMGVQDYEPKRRRKRTKVEVL